MACAEYIPVILYARSMTGGSEGIAMKPETLARELGISGKTLRAWLRRRYPRSATARYQRWQLSDAQVEAARRRFPQRWTRAESRRGMVTTTATFPTALHRRLRGGAAAQRIPLAELLRRIATAAVAEPGGLHQRFASPFLTHFVGRGPIADEVPSPAREEAQFGTLLAILGSHFLADSPDRPPGSFLGYSVGDDPLCSNEMVSVSPVCFCDIPLDDLGLHMDKYGEFGLGFQRPFLVTRGASPVFYVARDSFVRERFVTGTVTRGEYFNEMGTVYGQLRAFVFSGGTVPGTEDADLHVILAAHPELREEPAVQRLTERLNKLMQFLDPYVFGYVKCFDSSLPDDDDRNFYLEREWRVPRRIDFTVDDVAFIVVPRAFVSRLRREFPAIPSAKIRIAEDCRRGPVGRAR